MLSGTQGLLDESIQLAFRSRFSRGNLIAEERRKRIGTKNFSGRFNAFSQRDLEALLPLMALLGLLAPPLQP